MNVQIRTFLPFHYDSLTKISDVLKENLPQKIENVGVFSNIIENFSPLSYCTPIINPYSPLEGMKTLLKSLLEFNIIIIDLYTKQANNIDRFRCYWLVTCGAFRLESPTVGIYRLCLQLICVSSDGTLGCFDSLIQGERQFSTCSVEVSAAIEKLCSKGIRRKVINTAHRNTNNLLLGVFS